MHGVSDHTIARFSNLGMLSRSSDGYVCTQSLKLRNRLWVVDSMLSITVELLEWSKMLVPSLGVCRENSFPTFVWDTAPITESECPVDAVEANESFLEQ